MDNSEQAVVVLCSCPLENKVANELAHVLVETKLAACVNILSPMQSIYRWQGQIEEEDSALLIIKSTRSQYSGIEEVLLKLHPHDVPEIIMLPIEQGSSDYLKWLTNEVVNKKPNND